jgi:hypothetical protein
MSHLPQVPENNRRVHFEVFENWQRYVHCASQGAPPASTKRVANFATGTAGVVDNGVKFATDVNDTGGGNTTGGKEMEQ